MARVSGVIDSALTSTLSSLTGIKAIAVSMPITTTSNNKTLSDVHGLWLINMKMQIILTTIDLTSIYNQFNSVLINSDQNSDLALPILNLDSG